MELEYPMELTATNLDQENVQIAHESPPQQLARRHKKNSMYQLASTLEKNFIEKRRNICTTFFEFMSHFIILSLLVYGFDLSKVLTYNSQNYDTVEINIPPSFVNQQVPIQNFSKSIIQEQVLFDALDALTRPLAVPTFDMFIEAQRYITATIPPSINKLIKLVGRGRQFGNLLNAGVLHFAPYPSALVDSFIDYMLSTSLLFHTVPYFTHPTEETAVEAILGSLENYTLALIVFREVTADKINYVLRMNYSTLPNTNTIIPNNVLGLNTNYEAYLVSGFLTLQDCVDRWAFRYTGALYSNSSAVCPVFPNLYAIAFPTYMYNENPFYNTVSSLLGLALTMSMLFPVSRLVKAVVEEKETRMREVLRIMGLREWVHQTAWLITGLILFAWIGVTMALLLGGTLLVRSSTGLLLAFFVGFCLSLAPFCFLVSVFFSNAKISAICGPVALVFAILPSFIFYDTALTEGVGAKIVTSLFSPTAFSLGCQIIANLEYIEVGLQSDNIDSPGYNVFIATGMMYLDGLLYLALAWYLDQVLPQEHGPARHFLFPLQPSYWRTFWTLPPADGAAEELLPETGVMEGRDESSFESLTAEQLASASVVLRGICKRYGDGKLAVRRLDLELLSGQITCLLGHNGAGKSTTIAMLTGMTAPTGGHCSIFGYSLARELLAIREITGICPQANVLFPALTVHEHLLFFGSIKGLSGEQLLADADRLTAEVGLQEKRDVLSRALSGGMKRKLCLAMALIGDPLFVLLDEPTSGMDPHARRAIWDLLQRHKKGRAVLLTTHYLDEADIVSDRVAILSEGVLRCAGSSLFLKNRFGAGYVLSIAKSQDEPTLALAPGYAAKQISARPGDSTGQRDSPAPYNISLLSPAAAAALEAFSALSVNERISAAVRAVVPAADLVSQYAGELVYQLPLSAAALLGDLFATLQAGGPALGVVSFGVSITSLEQVFIRLALEEKARRENRTPQPVNAQQGDLPPEEGLYGAVQRYWTSVTRVVAASGPYQRTAAVLARWQPFPSPVAGDTSVELSQVYPRRSAVVVSRDSEPGVEKEPSFGEERKSDLAAASDYSVGISSSTRERESMLRPTNEAVDNNVEKQHSGVKDLAATMELGAWDSGVCGEGDDLQKGASQRATEDLAPAAGWELVQVQMTELLRKRLIIASRDKWGFFFQIAFPAIQILLVLSLLTVIINPAGHTLRLWGSSFPFQPTALPGGRFGPLYEELSSTRMNLQPATFVTNSSGMSDYLLADYFGPHPDRYGAFIFNNTIPFNVTVSWGWVQDNWVFLSETLAEILAPLVGPQLYSMEVSPAQASQVAALLTLPETSLLLGELYILQRLNYSLTSSNLTNSLGLNTSEVNQVLHQQLNTSAIYQLVDSALLQAFDNSTLNVTLSFAGVEYFNGSITLEAAKLEVDEETVFSGDLTVNLLALAPFIDSLPASTQRYFFNLPVPYTVMHNSSSNHGIAIFNGELRAAYYKRCSPVQPSEEVPTGAVYVVKNHPLPLTAMQTLEYEALLSLFTCLFILIPLCYIPAAFVAFLVRERASKAKHLQLVSSVNPSLYWLATYVWDMFLFLWLVLFIMISFFIYSSGASFIFVGSPAAGAACFLLLVTYGMSVLPLCYMYSMFFESHTTCQIVVTVINFFTGFIFVLAYFIMISVPQTKQLGYLLVNFFRIFPCYNIGEGLIAVTTVSASNALLGESLDYYAFANAGRNMAFMAAEAAGFLAAVLLSEWEVFRILRRQIDNKRLAGYLAFTQGSAAAGATHLHGDDDVAAEARAVDEYLASTAPETLQPEAAGATGATGASEQGASDWQPVASTEMLPAYSLLLQGLDKVYPPTVLGGKAKHALRGLTLGLRPGERFGFLGVNGAGKSTTMAILTGDVEPTSGHAFVAGLPLSDPRTRLSIGFCPQTDPLLDLLNSYETLWFFGRIRGIAPAVLGPRVRELVHAVGLTPHAARPCGNYSGGNKRKLSLAVALIGDPALLLLDEPSSGMDPEARRNMWDVIARLSERRTVVLTTHSMEECEALCSRIGIMVQGSLQCLGSSQHLKSKFGRGYETQLRCASPEEVDTALVEMVARFPGTQLQERHDAFLSVRHPRGALDLAAAFRWLEAQKAAGALLDYAVTQTSLEQIFVAFAAADPALAAQDNNAQVGVADELLHE